MDDSSDGPDSVSDSLNGESKPYPAKLAQTAIIKQVCWPPVVCYTSEYVTLLPITALIELVTLVWGIQAGKRTRIKDNFCKCNLDVLQCSDVGC